MHDLFGDEPDRRLSRRQVVPRLELDVVQGVARAFDFKAVGSQLRECIRLQLGAMVEVGDLVQRGDLLVIPEAAAEASRGTEASLH